MQCQECGFDNPTTEAYCRACGKKIKYSRDKVEGSLLTKAESRDADELEEQCRSFLVIVIVLFLASITMKVMYSPGKWPRPVEIPASSMTASYSDFRYVAVEPPAKAVLQPPKLEPPK